MASYDAGILEGFKSANPMMIYGLCALLFGALGYSIGSTRAFMLKVKAQELLCQKQIEENTRRAVQSSAQAAGHRLTTPSAAM